MRRYSRGVILELHVASRLADAMGEEKWRHL
jgi:hypothetical protein